MKKRYKTSKNRELRERVIKLENQVAEIKEQINQPLDKDEVQRSLNRLAEELVKETFS